MTAEDTADQAASVAKENGQPRPIHWPSLKPSNEARDEWNSLRIWVEHLRVRFPNAIRLPDCWWRHNDLVEVLAALRDHERASYHPTASATGPVEWQRALRDMETRIDIWIKRFNCTVPGRRHELLPVPVPTEPAGWQDFVEEDLQRRQCAGDNSSESPTCSPSK